MNVARSTFMRKGYLLTALAVAVLLAGSSGTSWAQTIRFSTSRASLPEGASDSNNTPEPYTVTIRRSGNFDGEHARDADGNRVEDDPFEDWAARLTADYVDIRVVEYDGEPYASVSSLPFTFRWRSGDPTMSGDILVNKERDGVGFKADETRDSTDGLATAIELIIQNWNESNPMGDPGDWNDETLVLRLEPAVDNTLDTFLDENELNFSTREFTLTINDDDPQPVFKFREESSQLAKTDIKLAEGNEQMVMVGVGIGAGGEGSLPDEDTTTRCTTPANPGGGSGIKDNLLCLDGAGADRDGSLDRIVLSVSPADAVGPSGDADRGLISIMRMVNGNGAYEDLKSVGQGRYAVGTISGAVAGIRLKIKAKDVSGFRDEMVSLMLMDGRTEDQMDADGGAVGDAAPATVTILSGAETPTVTFSKESISLEEGESETVHLLAAGMQGDEVGAATVVVRGEARISLRQNGSPVSGLVSFGGNANAELTIVANSDPSLEEGEEKTATVTITDANGALIGDPGTLTVTVVGATAVPVLPLFAQLLLALLLMVGGARLYRRHQG